MHDLRLIGVHDDGVHLLLVASDGTRYRLPLDEALRAAARRDRPRLGQLQIEIEGGLRPRDVQALIRAGMPSAEVAERAGWTMEKVAKYEGPILAEREYIAGLARATTVRGRTGAASLAVRVAERMASREVRGDSLDWDAWRKDGF
ncbi:MAG: septation protein SepH [Dermatophilaceae bacterium]